MAYLAWAWESWHQCFCSGSPLKDRRWKAVSNSWESHFPTIFPWSPLKAIYSSLFHHGPRWDIWMGLGLPTAVLDNPATVGFEPLYPYLLPREPWAVLYVFSGSIRASNWMTDMRLGGHGSPLSSMPCLHMFHSDMSALSSQPPSEKKWNENKSDVFWAHWFRRDQEKGASLWLGQGAAPFPVSEFPQEKSLPTFQLTLLLSTSNSSASCCSFRAAWSFSSERGITRV